MAANDVATGAVSPGNSPLLLRRVLIDVAGVETWLLRAHLFGIAYTVTDLETGAQVGTTGTLTVADTVYDTPQTGTTWTNKLGPQGGNFAFRLPGSYLPDPGVVYVVKVTFTLTGGTFFDEWWNITTLGVRG